MVRPGQQLLRFVVSQNTRVNSYVSIPEGQVLAEETRMKLEIRSGCFRLCQALEDGLQAIEGRFQTSKER